MPLEPSAASNPVFNAQMVQYARPVTPTTPSTLAVSYAAWTTLATRLLVPPAVEIPAKNVYLGMLFLLSPTNAYHADPIVYLAISTALAPNALLLII